MSLTVFNRSYLAQETALNIINVVLLLQLKSPTGRMGFSENLAYVTYAFALLIKNQVRNSEQRKLSLDFLGQNKLKMINEDFF